MFPLTQHHWDPFCLTVQRATVPLLTVAWLGPPFYDERPICYIIGYHRPDRSFVAATQEEQEALLCVLTDQQNEEMNYIFQFEIHPTHKDSHPPVRMHRSFALQRALMPKLLYFRYSAVLLCMQACTACTAPVGTSSVDIERSWAQVRWRALVRIPSLWAQTPEISFSQLPMKNAPTPRFVQGRGAEPTNARIIQLRDLKRVMAQIPSADDWLENLYRAASDEQWKPPADLHAHFDDTRYVLVIEQVERFDHWLPLPAQHDRNLLALTVEEPIFRREPGAGAPVAVVGDISGVAMLVDLNDVTSLARLSYRVVEDATGHQLPVLRDALRRAAGRRLRRTLTALLPADALPQVLAH